MTAKGESFQCSVEYDQWFDSCRIALYFALLKADRQHVTQIASFIGDDLYPDDGFWDRDDNDRFACWLLSEFVGGSRAPASAVESIAKGRAKRPKLLFELLVAVREQNGEQFEKSFRDLVRHFRDRELTPKARDINTRRIVTSIDASVMCSRARFNGLDTGGPEDDLGDYVVTKELLGMWAGERKARLSHAVAF